jgi:hypothetical protein
MSRRNVLRSLDNEPVQQVPNPSLPTDPTTKTFKLKPLPLLVASSGRAATPSSVIPPAGLKLQVPALEELSDNNNEDEDQHLLQILAKLKEAKTTMNTNKQRYVLVYVHDNLS